MTPKAYQASLSMEFFRQEYWTRLPFPSPGELPNPGIKSSSPTLRAGVLPSEPPGKQTEHQRIDAFEMWYWRRLLRVPWTVRRSNQSIIKETGPGCSLEGLTLRLKFQYFGHLMGRVDSLEKTLMLGGIGEEKDDRG